MIVRAKLSKRRGERRYGRGEDDGEKGKGGGKEEEEEEENARYGGCRSVQAARLVSRMRQA